VHDYVVGGGQVGVEEEDAEVGVQIEDQKLAVAAIGFFDVYQSVALWQLH
jgi:hypothetical protein